MIQEQKVGVLPEPDQPDLHINGLQKLILKCIYFADAALFALNLIFCLYIVVRFVLRNKDLKLGFIYYFYTFAITLSAVRLAQMILMILKPDEVDFAFYELTDPAKSSPVNLMDRSCDIMLYLFGCVIVYSIFQIGQKLQMIPM